MRVSGIPLVGLLILVGLSGCIQGSSLDENTGLMTAREAVEEEGALANMRVGGDALYLRGLIGLEVHEETKEIEQILEGLYHLYRYEGELENGKHRTWGLVYTSDGLEGFQYNPSGQEGPAYYMPTGDSGFIRFSFPFLWDVVGHERLPADGWIDSDEAAEKAAELEPDWADHAKDDSANILMVLQQVDGHPAPVWAMKMMPLDGSDAIVVVLDAESGDRLENSQAYPLEEPLMERKEITIIQHHKEHLFDLGDDPPHLLVRVEPTEDSLPFIAVTAEIDGDPGSEFEGQWPEMLEHRRAWPSREPIIRFESGFDAGFETGTTHIGAPQTFLFSWCVDQNLPDPLNINPRGECLD